MRRPIFLEEDNIAEAECLEMYDNSYSFYEAVLKSFIKEGNRCIGELIRLNDENNIDDYRIVVHGLKSSAGSVGAKDLQSLATDMDKSYKEGDYFNLMNRHDNLLKLLRERVDLIDKRIQS